MGWLATQWSWRYLGSKLLPLMQRKNHGSQLIRTPGITSFKFRGPPTWHIQRRHVKTYLPTHWVEWLNTARKLPRQHSRPLEHLRPVSSKMSDGRITPCKKGLVLCSAIFATADHPSSKVPKSFVMLAWSQACQRPVCKPNNLMLCGFYFNACKNAVILRIPPCLGQVELMLYTVQYVQYVTNQMLSGQFWKFGTYAYAIEILGANAMRSRWLYVRIFRRGFRSHFHSWILPCGWDVWDV